MKLNFFCARQHKGNTKGWRLAPFSEGCCFEYEWQDWHCAVQCQGELKHLWHYISIVINFAHCFVRFHRHHPNLVSTKGKSWKMPTAIAVMKIMLLLFLCIHSCSVLVKGNWKYSLTPHPRRACEAWHDAKNGKFSICCFCCFSLLCEHPPWQTVVSIFALHHADAPSQLTQAWAEEKIACPHWSWQWLKRHLGKSTLHVLELCRPEVAHQRQNANCRQPNVCCVLRFTLAYKRPCALLEQNTCSQSLLVQQHVLMGFGLVTNEEMANIWVTVRELCNKTNERSYNGVRNREGQKQKRPERTHTFSITTTFSAQ